MFSQTDAHIASTLDPGGPMPEGWTYIGEGSTRFVFRAPSGAVYKVNHAAKENANENEWSAYQSLKDKIQAPFAFPKMEYFVWLDVIAAEYIENESPDHDCTYPLDFECKEDNCQWEAGWVFEHDYNVWDISGTGNIFLSNGMWYVIDMGCP